MTDENKIIGTTTVQIKRSSVAGLVPNAASLVDGELAINTADGYLFAKVGSAVANLTPLVSGTFSYFVGPSALNNDNVIEGLKSLSDGSGNNYFLGVTYSTPTITDTSLPNGLGMAYKGLYGVQSLSVDSRYATLQSKAANPSSGEQYKADITMSGGSSSRTSISHTKSQADGTQLCTSSVTVGVPSVVLTCSRDGSYSDQILMKLASVQDTPNGLSATLNVINAGVMVYTSDSILTQGYADTRYAPIGGGGGGGGLTIEETDARYVPLSSPEQIQISTSGLFIDTGNSANMFVSYDKIEFTDQRGGGFKCEERNGLTRNIPPENLVDNSFITLGDADTRYSPIGGGGGGGLTIEETDARYVPLSSPQEVTISTPGLTIDAGNSASLVVNYDQMLFLDKLGGGFNCSRYGGMARMGGIPEGGYSSNTYLTLSDCEERFQKTLKAKARFSGTFTTTDGKTVTVVDGIVESIE